MEYAEEYVPLVEAIGLLAAYEDTKKTPEEISDMEEMFHSYRRICAGVTPERLKELVEADREGFHSGNFVWILERDEDGNVTEESGYVFVAACSGYAIVSPLVNDNADVEILMEYNSVNTAEYFESELLVYPLRDCYKTREAAEKALEVKNG